MKCVSVIMPAHDAAGTLARTLASLLPDSAFIREIVVVDDASDDGTGSVAGEAGRALGLPVRVLAANCRDAGAARNIGIEAATAPWLFFLDADDWVMPGGIGRLLERSRSAPEAGIVAGAYIRRVDGRDRKVKTPGLYRRRPAANAAAYLAGRTRTIAIGSALVRRAAVGATRFPVGMPYDEDTVFWARLIAATPVATVPDAILVYEVSTDRADGRFLVTPARRFLVWRRGLRALLAAGIPARVLKQREGIVALKIARVHYARGDLDRAARFLALAEAAPASGNVWRCLRYRRKIAARRRFARWQRRSDPTRRPEGARLGVLPGE